MFMEVYGTGAKETVVRANTVDGAHLSSKRHLPFGIDSNPLKSKNEGWFCIPVLEKLYSGCTINEEVITIVAEAETLAPKQQLQKPEEQQQWVLNPNPSQ